MAIAILLMAVVVGALFIPPIAFGYAACAASKNYCFDIDIPIGNYVGTNEQGYMLTFQVLAWDKAAYDADPNHGIKHLHADEPSYQGQKYYGFGLEIKKDGETIPHQIGNYRYASVSRRVEYINTLWCDFSSPAFKIRGNEADIHFTKEGPQVYFACSCPAFGSAKLDYLGASYIFA
ncbi:MAG: hypothetical protein IJU64_00025 [Bacilli bacterium]|nr:hypothetical protein [Bacilli bacterium]